jgi:hypothetical protein
LRHDPAMRWVVGCKAASGAAASPSQMGRFETRWLAAEKNRSALISCSPWVGLTLESMSSTMAWDGRRA